MLRVSLLIGLFSILAPRVTEGEEQTAQHQQPLRMPETAGLLLPFCESLPFDESRLVELLRVELLGDGIQLGVGENSEFVSTPFEALLRVEIPGCESSSTIDILAESPTTGRSQRRRIQLAEQTGRERVLALALAELLRRSWPALAPQIDPPTKAISFASSVDQDELQEEPLVVQSAETEQDTISEEERSAIREVVEQNMVRLAEINTQRPAKFLVDFFADGAAIPAFSTGFIGGGIGASAAISSLPMRLEPALGAQYGMATDPLGYVDMGTIYAALALIFGNRNGPWLLGIGPLIEVGWSWARGRPFLDETSSGSMTSPLVTISLEGTVRRRLSERLWLLMGAALGYVVVGLEAKADGRLAGAIEGIELSLSLGLSIGPRTQAMGQTDDEEQ